MSKPKVPKRNVTDIKEFVMFVKIRNLYHYCKDSDLEIYDSCRACLTISKKRLNRIKYVFALFNCEIVGIYNIGEWKQRSNLDTDFPKFPFEIRKTEIECANIAKECDSLNEMEHKCGGFNDFLAMAKINKGDDNKFIKWKSAYYFIKKDDELPDDIAAFKNCMLVKPNGETFFSGKGNRCERMYNFNENGKIKTDYK